LINIYTVMMAVIVALPMVMDTKSERGRDKYINIACLLMFIVMGCRDAFKIGNDSTGSYVSRFRKLGEMSYRDILAGKSGTFNNGFNFFMKFCHGITGGNYQIFIIILSAIIMLSFALFIKKYSVSPIQSFCYYWGLLYYTFMFSAEKQALAMSVLLFAFDAIMERKPIRFLALTILAGTIHFPAFIFLPAYLLACFEMDNGYIFVLAGSLSITFYYRNQLLEMMMNAYGNELAPDALQGVRFFRNKVILMIIILVTALFLRPAKKQKRLYKTLLLFMCMAICFQTYCGYNNIFERLADYYFQFAVVFIPMVFEFPEEGWHYLDKNSEKLLKLVLPLGSCAFGIVRFITYLQGRPDNLIPYHFFFK